MTDAVEAEATSEAVSFDWDGTAYEVLDRSEWTLETREALERGNYTVAIHGLVGDAQWNRLKRAKGADPIEVMNVISKALGFVSSGE